MRRRIGLLGGYNLSTLIAAGVLGGGVTVSPLLTDLSAYWKLEEASGTRMDSHGGYHLTDNNTVTQNTGILGNAAQFTAANFESLSVTKDAGLEIGNADATIWGWIYLDSLSDRFLAAVSTGNTNQEWRIGRSQGSLKFLFNVWDSLGTSISYMSTLDAVVSTWYFIAGRFRASDGKGSMRVNTTDTGFINGGSGPAVGGIRTVGSTFYLGRYLAAYHGGRLDAVGFSKRLLTDEELDSLYNGGTGLEYPF